MDFVESTMNVAYGRCSVCGTWGPVKWQRVISTGPDGVVRREEWQWCRNCRRNEPKKRKGE